MHGAVKTDPAACLACRPSSTEFGMFYLARASGNEHRKPVTVPAAEVQMSQNQPRRCPTHNRLPILLSIAKHDQWASRIFPFRKLGRKCGRCSRPCPEPIKPTPL